MMQVSLDELVDALAARERVLETDPQLNLGGIYEAAMPELSEQDRLDFVTVIMAMNNLTSAKPEELFVRGIEVGRELERRANIHRVES